MRRQLVVVKLDVHLLHLGDDPEQQLWEVQVSCMDVV